MNQAPVVNKSLTLFDSNVPVTSGNCISDKVQKIIATRKSNTAKRNERITALFNHKYNVERKRYDDVINELCMDFALAKSTIESVLKQA